MARWNGKPQDIGAGTRVAGCHLVRQFQNLRGQHPLAGNDAFELDQLPAVVTVRRPRQEIPVDQPTGETDTHPDPRLGDLVQLGGTR